MAVLLSEPARDFTGGEFVRAEQRPSRQSRPELVPLTQGNAVASAVNSVPSRDPRHLPDGAGAGVSHLRSGQRHTLRIPFHDAT
ncbi:MAG TPA: 2OG-Fe(II) oxygenase [Myxococcota bacterium]|nr:2OG-Fe(II) oxygenase [Myxococcota bacterium]